MRRSINNKRPVYREQGDRIYKIMPTELIEVNMEGYSYGVIGILHSDRRKCPVEPNGYAKVIPKKLFDKYYEEAMKKIKSAYSGA